jgi:hypothetical protein
MLKTSSPLKQLGQMEPILAGSIYVRSKPGIDGSETRIALAAIFVGGTERNGETL